MSGDAVQHAALAGPGLGSPLRAPGVVSDLVPPPLLRFCSCGFQLFLHLGSGPAFSRSHVFFTFPKAASSLD